MSILYFEIRVCASCGLRYPLTGGHSFGVRCPQCLGETRAVLKRQIDEYKKTRDIKQPGNFSVLVDNIRSAWNVGSIFRSADGFGFNHAYLCGITPTPEQEAVRKTALGAEEYISWSYHKNAIELTNKLKLEGYKIFALEDNEQSQPVSRVESRMRAVLLLGNEITGVDPELLDLADHIINIPMRGQKRSFNVANAFSIAAYALVEQF